ncbi:hypothetical protein N0V93_003531 [Gnomoniopsis smithogilvyi]|uniref:Protein kinase domain-containing protein n=1 Tax=Gnomoniopsis smithogilvyi TaxID=1191159 RepID=A0A9W8YYJ3_9PEZI|nr:hypothetical protein N0V93_003531 [Gnomoniopsis smithogilvyi]
MEMAELGTMNDLFHDDLDTLSGHLKLDLAVDIARGMQELEALGVVHGDLKASNVLIFSNPAGEGLTAKVSDFGFALRNFSWTRTGGESTEFKGASRLWVAPELESCFDEGVVTLDRLSRADVYTYGLLVWRLSLDGRTPFDDRRFATGLTGFESLLDETATLDGLAARMKEDGDRFLASVLASISDNDTEKDGTPSRFRAVISASVRFDPSHRSPSFGTILSVLGQPVLQDWAERSVATSSNALKYEIEAELNIPGSLLNKSLCFFLGFGVAPDFHQGLDFMTKAASQGDIRAKALVTRLHKACGQNEPPHIPSEEWLLEAASAGSSIAMEELRLLPKLDLHNAAYTTHSLSYRYGITGKHLKPELLRCLEKPFPDVGSLQHCMASISPYGWDAPEYMAHTTLHTIALAGVGGNIEPFLAGNTEDVNSRNLCQDTPLLCAVRSGHMDVAKALLSRGADPNHGGMFGETPLHHTVFLEPEIVRDSIQLLLDHGANIDTSSSGSEASGEEFLLEPNVHYGTPLMWAVQARRIDVVDELILHGADPTASQSAQGDDSLEVMFDLKQLTAEEQPIERAALNADAPMIKALFSGSTTNKQLLTNQFPRMNNIAKRTDFEFMYVKLISSIE